MEQVEQVEQVEYNKQEEVLAEVTNFEEPKSNIYKRLKSQTPVSPIIDAPLEFSQSMPSKKKPRRTAADRKTVERKDSGHSLWQKNAFPN